MAKTIKMNKNFFDLIQSGEKKYEFRRLHQGYTSGIYNVVDTQDASKYYGKIELKPVGLNNKIGRTTSSASGITSYWFWYKPIFWYRNTYIDKETYDFVKTNYVDKGIDFVVYEVKVVE